MNVLIVEDDLLVRKTICLHIRRRSYEPLEASTVAEALHVCEKVRPVAAIVDSGLPDAPGERLVVELVRWGIPCILFKGMDDDDAHDVTNRSGASGCFIKPVDADAILRWLDDVVGSV
jgi:DNA-binding response OmpR family regulator